MRPVRWKGRFRTGNVSADRRNRAFVDCINGLINAAGRREQCGEMEEFIDQFSSAAEQTLQERPANRDLKREFGSSLLASLPLGPFGGNACRKCGLCNVKREQAPDHLAVPVQHLFERHATTPDVVSRR
jgi:hypothetical protein